MMYEITTIKAIAECANETEIQDAILIHENNDEFSNGDCILFGYSADELEADEDITDALINNTPCTDFTIDNKGVYHAR